MPWPPDIAGDLPAPRDDEPSSLRQDIADELADHLQSSFTCELHFTPEETSAKQIVLDRFGDPRRIARQLWFDAMKERLMSQRLNLVLSSLMTAACLGALALMGMMLRESRMATQALLEQSQAANAALLDRLAALAAPAPVPAVAEPARSMEWNSVKIRLVKDTAGGAPAAGFTVVLHGFLLDTAKEIEIRRTTGTDGIADLGLVRPGQHHLNVWTPWKESRPRAMLTVLPGQSIVDEIVCPGAERETVVTPSFSVAWPDELTNKKLWLVAHASQKWREVAGETWSSADTSRNRLVVVDPEGTAVTIAMDGSWDRTPRSGPFDFVSSYLILDRPGAFADPATRFQQQGAVRGGIDSNNNRSDQPSSPPVMLRPFHFRYRPDQIASNGLWQVGQYTLQDLLVAESPSKTDPDDWHILDVLGGIVTSRRGNLPAESRGRGGRGEAPAFMSAITDWVDLDSRDAVYNEVELSQMRTKGQPVFELNTRVGNLIEVPVPQRLTENVRKFLQAVE